MPAPRWRWSRPSRCSGSAASSDTCGSPSPERPWPPWWCTAPPPSAPRVAMPRMTYGADADGYLPWVREALEVDGEPLPDLLDDNGSPPFEQIAAAMPDVILANYSGITQADYDKLDQIAPTIAYPDAPWTTPWRDVVT